MLGFTRRLFLLLIAVPAVTLGASALSVAYGGRALMGTESVSLLLTTLSAAVPPGLFALGLVAGLLALWPQRSVRNFVLADDGVLKLGIGEGAVRELLRRETERAGAIARKVRVMQVASGWDVGLTVDLTPGPPLREQADRVGEAIRHALIDHTGAPVAHLDVVVQLTPRRHRRDVW